MSFFDDYVADGLCCQCCGTYLESGEPGHPRWCEDCAPEDAAPILVVSDPDDESERTADEYTRNREVL